MGGRHRVQRARRAPSARAVLDALPVLVAATAVVAVVAVVVGGGLLDRGTAAPLAQEPAVPATAEVPRTGPLLDLPATDSAALAADDAVRAAAGRTPSAPATGCDLDGPPRFDDPAEPNRITNRDCGYLDEQGRERSHDPWIDGQLLDAAGN